MFLSRVPKAAALSATPSPLGNTLANLFGHLPWPDWQQQQQQQEQLVEVEQQQHEEQA